MNGAPIRIAMWSGPRNISTAMMRSFEARGDAAVTDEPFYAAYLERTGIDHPLREEVIGSQPRDWRDVAATLVGDVPGAKPIWYQKHMTLHLLEEFDRGWMLKVRNAFLIREPCAVLASYVLKREAATLADIGFVQQRTLFEAEADRLGKAPPVADAADILSDPARTLTRLCEALGIPFTPAMLHWPAGRRATDGIWAPAWYRAVENSTGFEAPKSKTAIELPPHLKKIADQAQPHYDALARYRLRPTHV
jgi:Sulfotransferase domain